MALSHWASARRGAPECVLGPSTVLLPVLEYAYRAKPATSRPPARRVTPPRTDFSQQQEHPQGICSGGSGSAAGCYGLLSIAAATRMVRRQLQTVAVARRRHLRQRPGRKAQLAGAEGESGAPRRRRPGGRAGASGGPRPRRWSMSAGASHRATQVAGSCVLLSDAPPGAVSFRTLTTRHHRWCGEVLVEACAAQTHEGKGVKQKIEGALKQDCANSGTRQSAPTAAITAATPDNISHPPRRTSHRSCRRCRQRHKR